jgi:4-hydroxybenzoate polyprenyltransferase
MLTTFLVLLALGLAACGVRDAVPDDANHPLLWIVGLSAAFFLLSAGGVMINNRRRRHDRREDRRDRRDERGGGEE